MSIGRTAKNRNHHNRMEQSHSLLKYLRGKIVDWIVVGIQSIRATPAFYRSACIGLQYTRITVKLATFTAFVAAMDTIGIGFVDCLPWTTTKSDFATFCVCLLHWAPPTLTPSTLCHSKTFLPPPRRYGVALVGVRPAELPEFYEETILLNPGPRHIMKKDDTCYYMSITKEENSAFVVNQNQTTPEQPKEGLWSFRQLYCDFARANAVELRAPSDTLEYCFVVLLHLCWVFVFFFLRFGFDDGFPNKTASSYPPPPHRLPRLHIVFRSFSSEIPLWWLL